MREKIMTITTLFNDIADEYNKLLKEMHTQFQSKQASIKTMDDLLEHMSDYETLYAQFGGISTHIQFYGALIETLDETVAELLTTNQDLNRIHVSLQLIKMSLGGLYDEIA